MILSDPTTVSVKWTAPWALFVVGALSLPFLPAPTWGGTPIAAAPVAAVQVPSGDQPAKAVTTPAETDRKPNTATTPGDQKGDPPATSDTPGDGAGHAAARPGGHRLREIRGTHRGRP